MEEEDEHSNHDNRSDDSSDTDSESELLGSRVYRLGAAERQELREKGIVIREGQWTGMEDQKLKDNMKCICEKYNIEEPRMLIFPDQYPNVKELRELIDKKNIFMKLRKGIQRPTYNVYIRARKIFDPLNYLGRFSDEEVSEMKVLAKKMGHQWSKIGKVMGRSGRALCDKYKISHNGTVSGQWTEEERSRLVGIVKDVSGFNEDRNVQKLYYNIPWTAVQERMKTRNVTQCRIEWIHIVSWAVADYQDRHTSRHRWGIEDNIRLIEKIYALDIHDEQDIDWMSLLEFFPNVPSPQKLQFYWHQLKVKHIHNHRFQTFEDIVCHLHDTTMPELRTKLQGGGLQIKSAEFVESENDDDDNEEDERDVLKRKTRGSDEDEVDTSDRRNEDAKGGDTLGQIDDGDGDDKLTNVPKKHKHKHKSKKIKVESLT